MAVLTTDKEPLTKWLDFNDPKSRSSTCAATGRWTSSRRSCRNAKLLLADTIADTVRAVAQGRADAIIENIDFFMSFTKNYPDVKWKVLDDTIFVAYDSIGVQRGNDALRNFLNVAALRPAFEQRDQRDLGEVVRRADAEEGRGEPILLRPNAAVLGLGCAPRLGDGLWMNYTFQFGVGHSASCPYLLGGAPRHLRDRAADLLGRGPDRALRRLVKSFGGPGSARLVNAYVIFFTNTPALIQIYFLYFGLPEVGILLLAFHLRC